MAWIDGGAWATGTQSQAQPRAVTARRLRASQCLAADAGLEELSARGQSHCSVGNHSVTAPPVAVGSPSSLRSVTTLPRGRGSGKWCSPVRLWGRNHLQSMWAGMPVRPKRSFDNKDKLPGLMKTYRPWHFLNFKLLPHQHGSLRPGRRTGAALCPLPVVLIAP